MPRLTQSVNELIGSVEDLNISDIASTPNMLRHDLGNLDELANSINKMGLLAPIVVRTTNRRFEIVAGNRRFRACKRLGWRKIPCHIVELDDKSAFEASLIENIHRHSLNVLEEGLAFRKYVDQFGWGAASELAYKLSKSSSYISKRMRLLDLPQDVLDLISESEISVSVGEELLSIHDKNKQSQLAMHVLHKSLSPKKLRCIIQNEKYLLDDIDKFSYSETEEKQKCILKIFDKSIISLRISMNMLAANIEKIQDEWIIFEILMDHKNRLNSQIDLLIREKKKFIKTKNFITR